MGSKSGFLSAKVGATVGENSPEDAIHKKKKGKKGGIPQFFEG